MEKPVKKKTPITYVVAKTRNDALMGVEHKNLKEAKDSMPLEACKEKWYCFAKFEKAEKIDKTVRGSTQHSLVIVSYYDCISPLGEPTTQMRWFDLTEYSHNETAKNKYKSIKV